jgi:hypothetical protein
MVLMYPQPTIFTERQYIPLTDGAKHLGEALGNDEALQKIAVRYGFRTRNPAAFQAFVKENKLPVPDHFVEVVNPPSFEVMEALIQAVSQHYQ